MPHFFVPEIHRAFPESTWPASAAALLVALLTGCASYGERVAPVPLPSSQTNYVDVAGVKLLAQPYADAKEAKKAFGFDIRGAGLLPVRFVIDNPTPYEVRVRPRQTFLIDSQEQAWPLLTSDQAYSRVRGHVELSETAKGAAKPAVLLGAAGALAGFAVGVLLGEDVGETAAKGAAVGASSGAILGGSQRYRRLEPEIREDLARQSLRNRQVGPGDLAFGYLFFPGKHEAASARRLRLGLDIGGRSQVVELPL